jgi:hypothetical protein
MEQFMVLFRHDAESARERTRINPQHPHTSSPPRLTTEKSLKMQMRNWRLKFSGRFHIMHYAVQFST